jgi:hypothetical protein
MIARGDAEAVTRGALGGLAVCLPSNWRAEPCFSASPLLVTWPYFSGRRSVTTVAAAAGGPHGDDCY